MPIYEYVCDDCETEFERIVLNKDQEIACPKCASKNNTLRLSVFSAPNGSANGTTASSATKSSDSFSGSGGGCCGGGCGCN